MSRHQRKTTGIPYVRKPVGAKEIDHAVDAALSRFGLAKHHWTSGSIKLAPARRSPENRSDRSD